MSRARPTKTFPGVCCLLACLAVAGPVGGQEPKPPEDAFRDEAARELILRARAAREREVEGIESYEGILRERVYVGLTALRFRRERALFEQERIARLRWTDQGERAVLWIGARRAVPILGADTRGASEAGAREEGGEGPEPDGRVEVRVGEDAGAELASELTAELQSEHQLPPFAFDPGGGDRLTFGDDWALHPLADTAPTHYRYRSGDTLRLGLAGRTLTLHEVRVEPRRADFHLVAASLWFEAESAALVRATYRPARPFDLGLDDPEEAREVPGLLQPVEAEIRFITVEYSLHELRYWLPRRFAMEGEARLGGVVRIPVTVEWRMGDYRVNEPTELPLAGALPDGWSRRTERVEEEDGSVEWVTVILPAADSLLDSPALSARLGPRAPAAFSEGEVRELRGELESLLPTYRRYRPDFAWGLEGGLLRYNRVEGLSVGASSTLPLSPRTTLSLTARMGTGDAEPYGTLALRHGPPERSWEVEGYHRLESMNPWDNPFSLPSSLTNLALGSDRGEYVRTSGAALGFRSTGRSLRWEVAGFGERHRPVSRTTGFYLLEELGLSDDSVALTLEAEAVELIGLRGRMDWNRGMDPDELILTGEVRGEVARGEGEYQRLAAAVSASHPLALGLAGALELAGGVAWGPSLPLQRRYFLGGSRTLRGFNGNELMGEAFWRSRGELGTAFPGARLALFGDVGWIGARESFSSRAFQGDALLVSAGVGASFLDGLFRLDLARALQGESRWKIHIYLDGLF